MSKADAMPEYLDWLQGMCGYAARTILLHLRIGRIWKTFLEEKQGKGIFLAQPADILAYIEHRQSSGGVNNTSLGMELCVLRSFYAYLYDYRKIFFNPAASIPEFPGSGLLRLHRQCPGG